VNATGFLFGGSDTSERLTEISNPLKTGREPKFDIGCVTGSADAVMLIHQFPITITNLSKYSVTKCTVLWDPM
jgi:hypothetical protein